MKSRSWYYVSSVIVLVPLLVGILTWNKLPDELPVHFDFSGAAYGYQSKTFAVFFVSLFILMIHIICIMAVNSAQVGERTSGVQLGSKAAFAMLSICPIASIVCYFFIYGEALNIKMRAMSIFTIGMGVIYILLGNYLTKIRQNTVIGIKLPWLLPGVNKSSDNWDKTNRIAAYLLCIFGILFMIETFVNVGGGTAVLGLLIASIILPVAVPTIYAIYYSKKSGS